MGASPIPVRLRIFQYITNPERVVPVQTGNHLCIGMVPIEGWIPVCTGTTLQRFA